MLRQKSTTFQYFTNYKIFALKWSILKKISGNIWGPQLLSGFVCTYLPGVPGSKPNYTIYAFSIYRQILNFIVSLCWEKCPMSVWPDWAKLCLVLGISRVFGKFLKKWIFVGNLWATFYCGKIPYVEINLAIWWHFQWVISLEA